MTSALKIRDAQANLQQLDLGVESYKAAAEANMSLPQFLNQKYPTNAKKDGTAFAQIKEQLGVFVQGNKEFGIRATTVGEMTNPTGPMAAIVREGVPASRLLFPAVMLELIEDKLQVNYDQDPAALTALVAQDTSINGERFERPVISYTQVEKSVAAPVAQLAMPNAILSITASDKAMRVPTWGIGVEISDQAQQGLALDLLGMVVSRQAAVERNSRANAQILTLLQGDTDLGMAALSTFPGKVQTARSLDSTIAAGAGVLSQKAWVKWLSQRSNKRRITHVITDIDGAAAIEGRTGKPVITGDNPNSPRMDTLMAVLNPKWPAYVQVYITDNPSWPANTIVGLDQRYGIHRVMSLTAAYSAVEQYVMRRATALRMDQGSMIYRLFDEAFEVLTLTA